MASKYFTYIATALAVAIVAAIVFAFIVLWRRRKCLPTCGEHGVCVAGRCACNDGWKGDKCTVQPPRVQRIRVTNGGSGKEVQLSPGVIAYHADGTKFLHVNVNRGPDDAWVEFEFDEPKAVFKVAVGVVNKDSAKSYIVEFYQDAQQTTPFRTKDFKQLNLTGSGALYTEFYLD